MGSLKFSPARTTPIPKNARRRPTPPPSIAITSPSVRSGRIMRPRLAPRLRRIASSFWRPTERVSNSPATFAHAMSSTKPTTVMIHPGAGLLESHIGGKSCKHLQVPALPRIRRTIRGRESQRSPELRRESEKTEIRGHHPNHDVFLAVEPHPPADK